MQKKIIFPLFIVGCLLSTSLLNAKTYTVDTKKSSIAFSIKEIRKKKVYGSFSNFEGTVKWTPSNLSKSTINGTISIISINTKKKLRDRHLRGKKFFKMEKFPLITYKSTRITKTKTGYLSEGILQVKDTTNTVTIPFTIKTQKDGTKHITATTTLDRLTLGLTSHKRLISKEVTVDLDIILTDTPPTPKKSLKKPIIGTPLKKISN